MNLTPQLANALEACRAVQATQTGEFCYRWIPQEFKNRGVKRQQLRQLARLGYLTRVDQSRGGSRVYHRVNPGHPQSV
jgi:hypothetical protein